MLLTIEQLAERLQMNATSLREMALRGEVPGCRKVGKAYRAHWPAIVEWMRGDARGKKGARR